MDYKPDKMDFSGFGKVGTKRTHVSTTDGGFDVSTADDDKNSLIDEFMKGRCNLDSKECYGKQGDVSPDHGLRGEGDRIGLLLHVAEEAEKDQSGANTTTYEAKKQEENEKPRDKEIKRARAAKDREFKKFKEWFDLWMVDESNQRVHYLQEGPMIDETFLEYAECMIKNHLDMDEHTEQTKRRLLYLLQENNSNGKTMAAMWWMTVKALGKVPRGIEYKKTNCPVCIVAEKKIIENDGHDCPYCHICFHESGWKKTCIKLRSCKCDKSVEA